MTRRGPTEKQFMAQVIRLARLRGWLAYHTHDSRRCAEGFPDLACVRIRHGRGFFLAELKSLTGKVRPEQEAWLSALRSAGVAAYLWTPASWEEIERVLE